MRQYRGLTKDGKWVYGWYTEAEDYYKEKKHFIILNNSRFYPFVDGDEKVIEPREYSINIIEVIPETVGQATGLKDKNGKEGYQSNIALCSDGEYGCVVWKDAGWFLKKRSKTHTDEWYAYIDLSYCIGTLEFVGTIHTTPKLLEKE